MAVTRMRRALDFLAGRRGPWVVALLGVLLAAPAVGLGLGVDDLFHRARLKGLSLPGLGRTHNVYLELFDFIPTSGSGRAAARDSGFLPWWVHPEVRIRFPRPLSAATHVLDYRLWPDSLALQHAHSLLWYAAAILIAVLLLRRLCRAPQVAALASVLFAASDTHVLPAGWLCNRNALLCFVLGGLAILAHVRWRREGGVGRLAVALSASAAALLGGEAAIGAFGYIAAYELFLDEGPVARRLLALLPYGLLVAGWQLGYRALGFGCAGSGWYQDPAVDRLGFIAALGERLPVLLLAQWARVSADILFFLSRPLQVCWAFVALFAIVLLGLVFRRQLREDAEARFWAGGMLLSLLPACAAFPMDRVLLFPGVGAFALLAGQVARLSWIGEAGRSRPAAAAAPARRATRLVVGGLLVIHAVLSPLAFPVRLVSWGWMQRTFEQAERAVTDDPAVAGQSVVWVNGTDLGNLGVLASRIVRGAPVPRASHVLTSFVTAATMFRPDVRTLVVLPDGGFLARSADRLLRGSRPPFQRGERLATLDYTATVEEVTHDGRPLRVSFRFRAPLEDPSFRWLTFGDGYAAHPFRLPQVGESVRLPAPRL
jgi:hypothetical protein